MLKLVKEALKNMGAKLYSNVDGKWHEVDDLPNSATGKTPQSSSGGQKHFDGWPQNGTVTTYTTHPDHPGDKDLWEWEGIAFGGAAKYDLEEADETFLLINLSGTAANDKPKEPKIVVEQVPTKLKDFNLAALDYTINPKAKFFGDEMLVEWGDQRAPRLIASWWKELLKALKASDYQKVIVCCVGGHGRTGTALCSLRLAQGLDNNTDDSVNWVREHHCDKAVESKDQIAYLDYLSKLWYGWDPPKAKK